MSALQETQKNGQNKEGCSRILGDAGQHGAGTRAEEGIGGCTAKGHTRTRLLLRQLDQHQQNQKEAVQDQNECQQANQETHRHNQMQFFTMSEKVRTSKDAPPTSAPSTSGRLIRSRALEGFTLPPYWMRTRRATVSS